MERRINEIMDSLYTLVKQTRTEDGVQSLLRAAALFDEREATEALCRLCVALYARHMYAEKESGSEQ